MITRVQFFAVSPIHVFSYVVFVIEFVYTMFTCIIIFSETFEAYTGTKRGGTSAQSGVPVPK